MNRPKCMDEYVRGSNVIALKKYAAWLEGRISTLQRQKDFASNIAIKNAEYGLGHQNEAAALKNKITYWEENVKRLIASELEEKLSISCSKTSYHEHNHTINVFYDEKKISK